MSEREPKGMIHAFVLDGHGGARALAWPEARAWASPQGPLWLHMDRSDPNTQTWVRNESGLDPLVCDALLAEETRPRCTAMEEGLLVILRGVNLNPGAEPEDMIAVRLWVEQNRVITLRLHRIMAIHDLRERLQAGRGPASLGALVVRIAGGLIERMGPTIDGLDERLAELEERVLENQLEGVRIELAALRREIVALRRYVAPQRDAMARLITEPGSLLTERHRAGLREVTDQVTRYVEELDAARERAAVTQEELASRMAEQMNRTMYLLSIVAAIFLPLGLLTGLLGINVGGIPGAEVDWAFLAVCTVLVAIAGLQLLIFRRLRWF